MARPIKETPVLRGRDAKAFLSRKRKNIKADPMVKERILRNYERMKLIIKLD